MSMLDIQGAVDAHRSPLSGRWLQVAALCLLLVFAASFAPARAAGVNGLWTTSTGDFAVFLQDGESGATFSLQVPRSFDSLKVWMGTGSATAIALQNLAHATERIDASVSGTTMSGRISTGSVQQSYGAELALAWVPTDYAGVWQKADLANAYLVFCLLNNGGATLGVQIDVTVNADKTYTYESGRTRTPAEGRRALTPDG